MKVIFLAFLVVPLFLGGEELCLVKDGVPCSVIVTGKKPTRAAQFASFELQHVIKLITGAEIPIREENGKDDHMRIFVGVDADGKNNGSLKGEEYVVRFQGKDIVLSGNDSPDFARVDYRNPKTFPPLRYTYRSTTFAVYDFLEKACGVRFYSFGDAGIAYKQRRTLSVASLDIRRAPAMDAYRRPNFSGPSHSERDDLLLRLRWRENCLFGETNHNVYSVYYTYWGKAKSPSLAERFIEHRPEYFAQGYEGKNAPNSLRTWQYPGDANLPPQLCSSNDGPVKHFAEEAVAVYKTRKTVPGIRYSDIVKMPGKPFYYPVQEDDNELTCQCPKCREMTKKYDETYLHFQWINRIAEETAKLNPEVYISTLAYAPTGYPDGLKIYPNVMVQITLSLQSWYHPLVYQSQHGVYRKWIEKEAKNRPLGVWLYLLCPAHEAEVIYKYNKFFPVMYPRHAGKYFQEIARDGVRGVFAEANMKHHALEAYLICKLADDPSLDWEKLMDEYFELFYGSAGPAMKEFYTEIEKISYDPRNYPSSLMNTPIGGSFIYGLQKEKTNWSLGTPERMATLQKIMDKALASASSPIEKQRVQTFIDDVWKQAVEGKREFEVREKIRKQPVPLAGLCYSGEFGGNLQNVDFSNAFVANAWKTPDNKNIEKSPSLSLLSDSKYLYIRYQEDSSFAFDFMKMDMWSNGLEMFFSDNADSGYHQLAVGPDGAYTGYRRQVINGIPQLVKWNTALQVKSVVDKNTWKLDIVIPLAELGTSGMNPGEMLYANFFRTRRGKPEAESLCWSPIYTNIYADGLSTLGKIVLAVPTKSGEVDLNGNFRISKAGSVMPDGWIFNKNAGTPPLGIAKCENGVLNIICKSDHTHVFNEKIMRLNTGDSAVFEFKAKGRGTGSCSLYYFNDYDFQGITWVNFELTPEMKDYRILVPVKLSKKGMPVTRARAAFIANNNSELNITGLKFSILSNRKDFSINE